MKKLLKFLIHYRMTKIDDEGDLTWGSVKLKAIRSCSCRPRPLTSKRTQRSAIQLFCPVLNLCTAVLMMMNFFFSHYPQGGKIMGTWNKWDERRFWWISQTMCRTFFIWRPLSTLIFECLGGQFEILHNLLQAHT